jgi:hypothetical protein
MMQPLFNWLSRLEIAIDQGLLSKINKSLSFINHLSSFRTLNLSSFPSWLSCLTVNLYRCRLGPCLSSSRHSWFGFCLSCHFDFWSCRRWAFRLFWSLVDCLFCCLVEGSVGCHCLFCCLWKAVRCLVDCLFCCLVEGCAFALLTDYFLPSVSALAVLMVFYFPAPPCPDSKSGLNTLLCKPSISSISLYDEVARLLW